MAPTWAPLLTNTIGLVQQIPLVVLENNTSSGCAFRSNYLSSQEGDQHDIECIHNVSRRIEPDRNRFGLCCSVRPAQFEPYGWLDDGLSYDNRGNQRYRLPLPGPSFPAVTC